MSQMPEMSAAGWAEQGYDPSAYPQQAQAQTAQTQGAHAQAAQPAAVWQQDTEPDWGASQQGYPEQQYSEQQYPAQQGYQPQQAAGQDADSGLPTEFDHLFRDSTPDSRRAIDRQKPMVGGAGQPFPQQPGPGQYQGAQFQGGPGPYPQSDYQPDYQQGGGYGEPPSGGFGGGGGFGGALRNRRNLAIGGAVALAAIIGIVIATSGGSHGAQASTTTGGTPTATPSKTTAKQQADQIYQLIEQSSQLRSDANSAVVAVNGCKNLAAAQSALAATAQKRQAQADGVAKLDVSGIQNGAQLVEQLKAAWAASAQYDNAYAQLAGDMQAGSCKTSTVRKDSNYQAAHQAAGAADDAKAQAARLWNDNVATPLGESQVTSDKL